MLEGADFQDGSPPGAQLLPGPLEQHSCRACTEGPSLRKGAVSCAPPPHPTPARQLVRAAGCPCLGEREQSRGTLISQVRKLCSGATGVLQLPI